MDCDKRPDEKYDNLKAYLKRRDEAILTQLEREAEKLIFIDGTPAYNQGLLDVINLIKKYKG
jgi:hypothetical protein